MKNMLCILLFSCIALSVVLADTIFMKNGLKIDGEIQNINADSVTIKTSSGILTIAAVDIASIETTVPEPPAREISEGAIPKSITTVGYGCLGGVILGGVGTLLTIYADGFDNAYLAATVIIGSAITGILIGAEMGSK
ncbi:hypothetical protein IBX73_01765 [candidate division WOR-3 bacterium]|nr:hypothetical protein [candidate division WOR-3 bacterium]